MKNPEKFWTKLCQKECARYGYNHHQGYITTQLEQEQWDEYLTYLKKQAELEIDANAEIGID